MRGIHQLDPATGTVKLSASRRRTVTFHGAAFGPDGKPTAQAIVEMRDALAREPFGVRFTRWKDRWVAQQVDKPDRAAEERSFLIRQRIRRKGARA